MELTQFLLRWPKHLLKAVAKRANIEGTSMLTVITEAFLDSYGISHWRKQKDFQRKVDEILEFYKDDLQRQIAWARGVKDETIMILDSQALNTPIVKSDDLILEE